MGDGDSRADYVRTELSIALSNGGWLRAVEAMAKLQPPVHEQLARLFVENRFRIIQRARHPGPYIYGVYPGRLQKLFPR